MKEWAKAFYKSQAWKKTRAAYAASVGGLCERCLARGIYRPGEIVHHKVHLTPDNVTDPNVSLCWDNLQLVCRECHAELHSTRQSRYKIDGISGNVDCNQLYNSKMQYAPETAAEPAKEEVKSVSEKLDGEIIESATKWMEDHANDNSHGYDQKYRWGEKGDYDCSSAVISAWQAAGTGVKDKGATYTGNMKKVFLENGFKDVTSKVSLKTGKEFLIRSYRNYPWDCVLRYGKGEIADMPTVEYKDTGTAVYIWQCFAKSL